MARKLKSKVAVGIGVVAVAAGGGIAYAATQTTPQQERQAFLDDAAKRLNVTPSQLESALQAAAKARVDQAVADGRLTKAQGDAIKKRIDQGGGAPFLGRGGGPGFGHGPGGPGGPGRPGAFFGGLDAAATYLGLKPAELRTQLMSGKSLADIAKAQNKDVAGLKSALKDAAKTALDKAVQDKRLTQAQADEELGELDARLDDIVNATGRMGGRAWRGRGHGHGRPWGPPPAGGDGTSAAPQAAPQGSVS